MSYGLALFDNTGAEIFNNSAVIGWRLYEVLVVGATSNGSKNYTGIIPVGYELKILVCTVGYGGGHTASLSGYTLSYNYFTIPYGVPFPPGFLSNNPSNIYVMYR